jgi:glycosyltransferase involved in cell wall biosynthesis
MRLIAHNDGWDLRGSERQLLHLARGLRDRGHDVLVSCREGGALARELTESGVPITAVRPRGDLNLASAHRFLRLLGEWGPDALLLTSWKRVFMGSWLARIARVRRVVVRLGIVRPMPARGTAAWKLRRAFERQVHALVVNSDEVRRVWLESAPWFSMERVSVIRSAVAPTPGAAGKLRGELGLPATVRLLITVAALEPRKGIDLLVRALRSLPEDVQAVVAGEGPEAARLRELAHAVGVARRVHWLGARPDVPDLLADGAAFVLPTRQDSIPNALLEAMAAGVPVVTTSGNGAEEALGASNGRGPAGWIVAPEDPAALAAAIAGALAHPAAFADEARWRAEHWFGVERMVHAYERVLFPRASVPR